MPLIRTNSCPTRVGVDIGFHVSATLTKRGYRERTLLSLRRRIPLRVKQQSQKGHRTKKLDSVEIRHSISSIPGRLVPTFAFPEADPTISTSHVHHWQAPINLLFCQIIQHEVNDDSFVFQETGRTNSTQCTLQEYDMAEKSRTQCECVQLTMGDLPSTERIF